MRASYMSRYIITLSFYSCIELTVLWVGLVQFVGDTKFRMSSLYTPNVAMRSIVV